MKQLITFVFMGLVLASCSLWTARPKDKLFITTEPAGAQVFIGEKAMGSTPLQLATKEVNKYAKGGYITLLIKKEGYQEISGIYHLEGMDNFRFKLSALGQKQFKERMIKDFSPNTNRMIRKLLEIQGFMIVRDFAQAKRELVAFMVEYPNIASTNTMMATIELDNKDPAKAKAYLFRALQLDSEDMTAKRLLDELKDIQ